jgi:hypothetical protein
MRGRRVSPHAFWWASLGLGTLLGIAFFLVEPGTAPSLCVFRRVTNLPCPGCGMTRAVGFLLHGELLKSIRMHPFAPVLSLEAALVWIIAGMRVHRGAPLRLPSAFDKWALAHVVPLFALWLGRLASGTAPF